MSVVSVTGAGDKEVVAAKAGFLIIVTNYTILADKATTVLWKSGTTAISGAMALPAYGGASPAAGSPGDYLLKTAAGEALNMTLGDATANVRGHLTYHYQRA